MLRHRAVHLALLALLVLGTAVAVAAGAATAPQKPPRADRGDAAAGAGGEGEHVDLALLTRIRAEGLHRSQVMATIAHLTDRIGPRLTGSPALKEANEWTRSQLAGWGLANAHLEGWKFGNGWSFRRAVVTMLQPRETPLAVVPVAWTPGTAGEVRGPAIRLAVDAEADLEAWRGKLAGKIVLLDPPRDVAAGADTPAEPRRLSAKALDDLTLWKAQGGESPQRAARRRLAQLRRAERKFLAQEKALASIEASQVPWGIIRVQGGGPMRAGDPPAVTGLMMAAEPYNQLLRLLDSGEAVELAIDVQARYYTEDQQAYNTVAEIPGSDAAGEIVMAGAHLDSWHGGTGATDNAAGCAVVMEAARILAALHVKPRRTIRVALWSGEEEGLLGSNAYVEQHFATPAPTPPPADGSPVMPFLTQPAQPLAQKPEYAKLSVYFNVDNGSGRLRGIFAEENAAAAPIFAAWLAPLADLGATTVTLRGTGSTDHVSFDRMGLPGFQFIQDELDYGSSTHHTNFDVYDHLDSGDLMQAAVVLASFLYDAASRPQMMPRKPLPPPTPPAAARPRAAAPAAAPAAPAAPATRIPAAAAPPTPPPSAAGV